MVAFGGWEMPVQYRGILDEHRHTRQRASVFDTCHMSEFTVRGPGAAQALRSALACRLAALEVGQCRYGLLLNGSGGIVDDLVCYRTAGDEFMIVGNAGRRREDACALGERLAGRASFEDVSDRTAKLDLQGPQALRVLQQLCDDAVGALRYYHFTRMRVGGTEATVSRTGYTGELGYELYVSPDEVQGLWQRLLDLEGVEPAGLGCRDTLRLEAGYPLYGHEISESVNPVEAGLSWVLPAGAGYVGAEAVCRLGPEDVSRRLVGVRFEGRKAARRGDVLLCAGEAAGEVTSGSFAPSVGCAVALGYVRADCSGAGTEVEADVKGRCIKGTIVDVPFYVTRAAERIANTGASGQ